MGQEGPQRVILNLGAGKKLRKDAINVDVMDFPGIDQVVDLRSELWPWSTNSVDGIYVSHLLEHFPDQEKFLKQCYRILKPGGFLRIAAPHSSCITSIGCMGHYRTYSFNTFHDYLSKPWYMFGDPLFKTAEQRLNWWYEDPDAEGNMPRWTIPIIRIINKALSSLATRVPRFTENVICPAIQFREVIWKGVKL